ncbi:phosphoglycerate kinase [archaeon]|nr:phosphoglycerate kinase [archaeon]
MIGLPIINKARLESKKVLMRIDINSPLEPNTGIILDDSRFAGHIPTIKELSSSRLVLIAHQSRPGLEDFTTLEIHAEKLSQLLGREVIYVDDIIGRAAREDIGKLENGEILLLENVRFLSEEVHPTIEKKPPEEQAKAIFIRKLSSYVDFYINDAFAVSHRNQPSVVGFPQVLPSFAGRLLEKEVETLSSIARYKARPRIFSFGGAKAKASLKGIANVLDRGIADIVLTSGVIGNLFIIAKGIDIGRINTNIILARDGEILKEAKRLLKKYGDKIIIPSDVAVKENSERLEVDVKNIPNLKIMDIGIETIAKYTSIIKEAGMVAANGPCGVFEIEGFALGSEELVRAMAKTKAFTCIGGGHTGAITSKLGIKDKISFISTGGKASLLMISGDKLPGIEALREKDS